MYGSLLFYFLARKDRAILKQGKKGDQFILGLFAGVGLALLIGQLDSVLSLSWTQIILHAGGTVFGMYLTGLLTAWSLRHKGSGIGVCLVMFLVVAVGAILSSMDILMVDSNAIFVSRLLFVMGLGFLAIFTMGHTMWTHQN